MSGLKCRIMIDGDQDEVMENIKKYGVEIILPEDYIEKIAEKAADKAIVKMEKNVYEKVGRGVVSKFFYLLGVLAVGFGVWMKVKGYIK